MRDDRLNIDPRLGDLVIDLIERASGKKVHIILVAMPIEGEKLGQPDFVTSFAPDDMEQVLTSIAGQFVMAGERIVTS